MRRESGFTLVELMVTVGVLTTLAAIAFAGFRQDHYQGQYKRFVEDVHGAMVQARNHALDEQTPVRVDVEPTRLSITAWDQVNETWNLINRVALDDNGDALLTAGNKVCIYGFVGGVMTPAQAGVIVPLTSCVSGTQRLRFEADGTFSDPLGAFSLPGVGVSLWIGDRAVAGAERQAVVQVFPGGLIRTFGELES